MKRTTIFLDETAERELDVLARRSGEPRASLIREAIAEYLVRGREVPTSALEFVAIGRSGRADIAERHEEMLFRLPESEPPTTSKPAPARKAPITPARRSRGPR